MIIKKDKSLKLCQWNKKKQFFILINNILDNEILMIYSEVCFFFNPTFYSSVKHLLFSPFLPIIKRNQTNKIKKYEKHFIQMHVHYRYFIVRAVFYFIILSELKDDVFICLIVRNLWYIYIFNSMHKKVIFAQMSFKFKLQLPLLFTSNTLK